MSTHSFELLLRVQRRYNHPPIPTSPQWQPPVK